MEYKKTAYKKKAAAGKAEYKPKRGPLSKLMTEEEKAKAGILEWFTVHGSWGMVISG